MLSLRKFRLNSKHPAQALVEFSLTAIVTLMVLMMIIEVARIMQAYVTLQSAAREGARYAVTGVWIPNYAGDANLTSGWTSGSSNPLQHIAPCWPIFDDDPYAPAPSGASFYQPYRDPRTCSVESTVVQRLTGLNLNPNASMANREPNAYEIVVSGYTSDIYPTSDSFRRRISQGGAFDDFSYEDYYTLAAYAGDNAGLSRGYAGDPGKRVTVQIRYQFTLITPLLNNIVPSFPLQASEVMTNEQFGSTGVQSSAVAPPALPAVSNLPDPTPPDLIIPSGGIQLVTIIPPSPVPGQPVDFNVTVTNQGLLNTPTGTTFTLNLYASTTPISPLTPPLSGAQLIGSATVPQVLAAESAVIPVTTTFTSGGLYYIYGFVDATNVIDETGTGALADPAREQNNITDYGSTIPITDLADLFVTKTVDNPTPLEGATFNYTVTVQNFGPNDAPDVTITDNLPAGLTFVSAAPTQGSYAGGVWTIGTITNGTPATLVITARTDLGTSGQLITNTTGLATMAVSTADPNPSNNAASVDLRVNAADLALTKTVDNTNPAMGQTVTYTLATQNLSSTIAGSNVQITDALPSQLTYVSAAPSQGTCSQAGGTVTCDLGTINPSGNASVTISATVNTGTAGVVVTNTGSVSSSQTDLNTSNNTSSVSLTVQSVDVQVTKTASVIQTPLSGSYSYTVTAQNQGLNAATGVVVRDVLPATLTLGSTTPSAGTSYNSGTGDWTIGTLAVGGQATLTINVTVKSTVTNGTTITNTASLQSLNETDTNSANDTSSVGVLVSNSNTSDLRITKSVSPTTVNPNGNVVYTLTVQNNGPKNATSVVVTDATLRTAVNNSTMQLVSSSATAGSFVIGTGNWTIGTLNNGSAATLTITMRVLGNGLQSYANTATVTAANMCSLGASCLGPQSATVTLAINWPLPLFVNAGDASCNTPLTWGSTDTTLNQDYTWEPTKTYVAGSWGIYGSNYTRQPAPSSSITQFIGPWSANTPLSTPDGQSLMGCTVTGRDFYYRFDNLTAGVYTIVLAFADPQYDGGKRRFGLTATTQRGTTLLRNFDIAQSIITAQGGQPSRIIGSPTQVHYIIRTFSLRVTSNRRLLLHFTAGRRSGGFVTGNILVSGLGLIYTGP